MLNPSAMILFSTLPHQSTTPRWPAGTMAKEPHKKMKIMKRTIRIPIVLGFGPLNSKASNDLSGIAHLPGYLMLPKVSMKIRRSGTTPSNLQFPLFRLDKMTNTSPPILPLLPGVLPPSHSWKPFPGPSGLKHSG